MGNTVTEVCCQAINILQLVKQTCMVLIELNSLTHVSK